MKNLKDVLEKLKVDDITIDEFPLELTVESLIRYLKDCEYAEVPYISIPNGSIFNYIPYFNDKHGKYFIYTTQWREIYIADTSKSEIGSNKNPMFYLSIRNGKPNELKAYFKNWSKEINQDEFRRYFEKY